MAGDNPFKVGDLVRPINYWKGPKLDPEIWYEVTDVCPYNHRIKVYDSWMHHSHFKRYLPSPVKLSTEVKTASDGGSTSYYSLPEGSKELFDLINHQNMNFAVGNIFKACWRLGRKQGIDNAYDLRKIIFMAEQELKRIGG